MRKKQRHHHSREMSRPHLAHAKHAQLAYVGNVWPSHGGWICRIRKRVGDHRRWGLLRVLLPVSNAAEPQYRAEQERDPATSLHGPIIINNRAHPRSLIFGKNIT